MSEPHRPEGLPDSILSESETFKVEPTEKGYWCYFTGRRSAGDFHAIPLHETLTWVLEQISFGQIVAKKDASGDTVSLAFGAVCPRPGVSEIEVGKEVFKELLGFRLAGFLAQSRESGNSPKNSAIEEQLWQEVNENATRRMEFHYALELSRLLGHLCERLPSLEMLPILDHAPANTKAYIAEATRCYLLNLNRACISLCRACLEDTLKSSLTRPMQTEWTSMVRNQKKGPLEALIDVCAQHGVLQDKASDAHAIRVAGNRILHLNFSNANDSDLPRQVLSKTRTIVGLIYGQQKD